MQTVSPETWTLVAVPSSLYDNHYTMSASYLVLSKEIIEKWGEQVDHKKYFGAEGFEIVQHG